jgi:O-antigen/teichoic acid export membrane protein
LTKRPSLIANISALAALQLSTYLLPLITVSYTARVLGVAFWGKIALVQGVLAYFALFINWGFPWSATRKIAASHDDPEALTGIFSATIAAQAILTILASTVLLVLVASVPFFHQDAIYYIYGVGLLIGGVMFPNWLLSGLERMKEVASIQIASRVFAIALVFVFIKKPSDAPLLIAINAFSGVAAGVFTIYWIKRNLGLALRFPSAHEVLSELREGGAIFASTVSISLYVNLTPVVLGVMDGPVATGYYALADRVRQAAQSVLAPVSNALLPHMSRLVLKDPVLAHTTLRRSGAAIVGVSILISVALFVSSDQLVILIAGRTFLPSGEVLKWLSILPVVMSFSTFYGLQVLIPNKKFRVLNAILAMAAVLSLILIVPMTYWKGIVGPAITSCITEGFVSIAMTVYLFRSGFLARMMLRHPCEKRGI